MRKIGIIVVFIFVMSFVVAIEVETDAGNTNNYSVAYMKSAKGEVIMTFYYCDFDSGFEFIKQVRTSDFDSIEKVFIDGKKKNFTAYGNKSNQKITKKFKLDFKKNTKIVRK